jgi:hypothetical protein
VEAVDVLGEHGEAAAAILDLLLEFGECVVAGVWEAVLALGEPPVVPAGDELRVVVESLDVCEFHRVVLGPEAGFFVSEGRYSTFGTDPGTGQHHDRGSLGDELGGFLEVIRLFLLHFGAPAGLWYDTDSMEKTAAPLIIVDGDLGSLVALACASDESVSLGSGRSVGPCAVAWQPPIFGTTERERAGAVERQASLFNSRRLPKSSQDDLLRQQQDSGQTGPVMTQVLFSSLAHARELGSNRVIWPLHPGRVGDDSSIDLDLASAIIDRALLVEQLAKLDADSAQERICIETPHADLTDIQLVEIATDLAVPIKALWWWGSSLDEAVQQRERWEPLMQESGLWRSADRRTVANR